MKQIDQFEKIKKGESMPRTIKDPTIIPGMPGSGP